MSNKKSNKIIVNRVFTETGEYSIPSTKVYGLSISANIELIDDNSKVEFVAVDNLGKEYLIYDAYLDIEPEGKFTVTDVAEETATMDNVRINKIKVNIDNAKAELIEIIFLDRTEFISKGLLKKASSESRRMSKPDKINKSGRRRWIAKETNVSRKSYNERKKLYGQSKFPPGFEYYGGGIITTSTTDKSTNPEPNDTLTGPGATTEIDWRNIDGVNYVTPIKDQGSCGSCYAFAVCAAIEANYNIQGEQQVNLNLSEQQLLDCSGAGDCVGGFPSTALNFVINHGVVDETAYPYVASQGSCNTNLDYKYKVTIPGYKTFGSDLQKNETTLKEMLNRGVVSGGLYDWLHAMAIVGFIVVQEGNVFFYRNPDGSRSWKTIEAGDPLIGETLWIFKNSWGPDWGDDGYVYVNTSIDNIEWTHEIEYPISVEYTSSPDSEFIIETGKFNLHGNNIDVVKRSILEEGKYMMISHGTGFRVSNDYGATWTNNDLGDIEVFGVDLSDNGKYQTAILYPGDILVSNDYGQTFTNKGYSNDWWYCGVSGDGKYQVAIAPNEIYVSSDYGDTWTLKNSSTNEWYMVDISYTGQYMSVCAYGGYIYTSHDYGETWIQRDSVRDWVDISISRTGDYQIALVYGENQPIYVSSDYGETWTIKTSFLNTYDISISYDGKYQLAGTSTDLYLSSDYGETWNPIKGQIHGGFTSSVISYSGSNILVTDAGTVYKSNDYGQTWTEVTTDYSYTVNLNTGIESYTYTLDVDSGSFCTGGDEIEIIDSSIINEGKYILAGDYNLGLQLSNDYGDTWTFKGYSDGSFNGVSLSDSGQYQILSSYNNMLLVSSDYGETFTDKGSGLDWYDCAVSGDGSYQVAIRSDRIIMSKDYGETWTIKDSRSRYYPSIAISHTGKYISACDQDGYIYTSSDYGETWIQRDSLRVWYAIAMSKTGKYQIATVSGEDRPVYLSTDYGQTWTNKFSTRYPFAPALSYDGKYQVVGTIDSLYLSSNYGQTWDLVENTNNTGFNTAFVSYSGNTIILSGSEGISISFDHGLTWELVSMFATPVISSNPGINSHSRSLDLRTGSFSITGNDIEITSPSGYKLAVGSGLYSLTLNDISEELTSKFLTIDNTSITIDSTAFTADMTRFPDNINYTLTAENKSFDLVGNDAEFLSTLNYEFDAESSEFVLAGNNIDIISTRKYDLTLDHNEFSLSGNNTDLSYSVSSSLKKGDFSIGGLSVSFDNDRNYNLVCENGEFDLLGSDTTFKESYKYSLDCETDEFNIIGLETEFSRTLNYIIEADSNIFNLEGFDIIASRNNIIEFTSKEYNLIFYDVFSDYESVVGEIIKDVSNFTIIISNMSEFITTIKGESEFID